MDWPTNPRITSQKKLAELAAQTLDVKLDELREFEVDDLFNNNKLKGFICRRGDHRYGAIFMTHVNDKPRHQLILATPKFPYPMDRNGVFRFPKAERIQAYEKLDGTNIFGYVYRDGDGNEFVTYKTRLLPVVQESRFGSFRSYWNEMLQKYPDIPRAVLEYNGHGLGYELFGLRNKHLMIYDISLDTRLLYGVTNEGGLEPANELPTLRPCPIPALIEVTNRDDLVGIYKAMQAEMDALIVADETLAGYHGPEGRIWYMLTNDGWLAFKVKPKTIEAIHWAAGGLSQNIIMATAWNVLENHDECTPELLKELLLEEFNEAEIEIAWRLILKCSSQVNEEAAFRRNVLAKYDSLGINIRDDKVGVLRALSQSFPKNRMQKVYSMIATMEGIVAVP